MGAEDPSEEAEYAELPAAQGTALVPQSKRVVEESHAEGVKERSRGLSE
jgi:hypothetical protein